MIFLAALSLLATPLIPETPGQSKLLSPNQYGTETIESVDSFGLIRLNGTTVTDSVHVNGSLIANNAILNSFDVIGEANLTRTTIRNNSTVVGFIQAQNSKFEKPLTITSQKAVFIACELQGITLHQGDGFKGKQVLELKQGTIVHGPIVFESGKGEVYVYPGSQALDSVTGGKKIDKKL